MNESKQTAIVVAALVVLILVVVRLGYELFSRLIRPKLTEPDTKALVDAERHVFLKDNAWLGLPFRLVAYVAIGLVAVCVWILSDA